MITLSLENIFRDRPGTRENFSLRGKVNLDHDFASDGFAVFNLSGIIDRLNDGVRLVVESCEARFKTFCDRCLKPFDISVNFNFEIFLTNNNIEHLRNRTLVLDDQLVENSILTVPIKKICEDACRGLCSECGQNLNLKKCNCKKISAKKNSFSKILKGRHGPAQKENLKN